MAGTLKSDFVEIDGSYLEGGGQALRNALSLSCILGKPVRIVKIRANRPKPGLSHQHLHGLNLLCEITNAKVKGNTLASTEVEFTPGTVRAGSYSVDTHTAASITLVLQMVLPVLLFGKARSKLDVLGGTNVSFAPQAEFMLNVLQPNLNQFGIKFHMNIVRHGFYPRGNGRIILDIEPVSCLNAINLTNFGHVKQFKGCAYTAGRFSKSMAEEMKDTAERAIFEINPASNALEIDITAFKHGPEKARDNGAGVLFWTKTSTNCWLGSSGLVEKQSDPLEISSKAIGELLKYCQNELCVDDHMQDQLIMYMALASGYSSIKTGPLTKHTETAIYVAELMSGVKFDIKYNEDIGVTLVNCEGISQNNSLNV